MRSFVVTSIAQDLNNDPLVLYQTLSISPGDETRRTPTVKNKNLRKSSESRQSWDKDRKFLYSSPNLQDNWFSVHFSQTYEERWRIDSGDHVRKVRMKDMPFSGRLHSEATKNLRIQRSQLEGETSFHRTREGWTRTSETRQPTTQTEKRSWDQMHVHWTWIHDSLWRWRTFISVCVTRRESCSCLLNERR